MNGVVIFVGALLLAIVMTLIVHQDWLQLFFCVAALISIFATLSSKIFEALEFFHYKTMIKVPAPIKKQPIADFIVNSSCRKINAKINVMTTDNLSMGTTFDASPICSAL